MSPIDADPAKTWALVVGVGGYGNAAWNTEGPAAAALDFVEFLKTERKVGDERIELLVSGEGAPAGASAPTRQNVRTALQKLSPKRGELLIVFWSGHGAIDLHQRQRLFYADAAANDPLNIDFEALTSALATDWFPGFRRQLLIVDACAVAMADAFDYQAAAEPLPSHAAVDTAQAVLFGASRFETARAGLFWEVLRPLLGGAAGKWPSIAGLMEKIQKEFEERSEDQRPRVYLSNWAGDKRIRNFATGTALLPPEESDRLRELIVAALPGADLGPHYVEALRAAGMASQARDDATSAGLILNHLIACASPLPLLSLLLRIAATSERADTAADLRTAAETLADKYQVAQARLDQLAREVAADEPRDAILLVEIRDDGTGSYLLKAWLWRGGVLSDEPEYPKQGDPEGALSAEALRREIPKLVVRARRALLSETRLTLEFMAPFGLLSEDFDAWTFSFAEGAPPTPLGAGYSVVLRSLERTDVAMHDAWRAKWERLKANAAAKPSESGLWVKPGELDPDGLYQKLLASDDFCVGLLFAPGAGEPWVSYAIYAGVPALLWVRRQPDDCDAAQRSLYEKLGDISVEELPEWILRARKAALGAAATDPTRHLVLMWDDYDRQPPKPSDLQSGT